MSVRGGGTGRGRGSRGRGRGRGRGKTMVWEWERYKPAPDLYDNLFRLRKAPPTITHTLPNACPIPNAESRIISRHQTDDEYARNYYVVRITYHHSSENDASGPRNQSEAARDETIHVEMASIRHYVSPREIERFENAESRAEAEAKSVAERAEAEELMRKRLEKNARVPGMGRGGRMMNGLGLDSDAEGRTRGRPRGRGRGRGRGSWRGRGGYAIGVGENGKSKPLNHEDEDEVLQRFIAEYSSEGDEERIIRAKLPSPDVARSSLVANSALPVSPVAMSTPLHFSRGTPEEDDRGRMSSAAAQLQFERHERHHLAEEDESEEDGHRAKRRRTESMTSTHPFIVSFQSTNQSRPKQQYIAESPQPQSASSEDPIAPSSRPQSRKTYTESKHEHFADHEDENNIDVEKVEDDDAEEYVVETILDHNFESGLKYYLVKWQGYDDSSDWLHEDDLAGAKELVRGYHRRLKKRPMR
ncbi:hypothetical protein P280DRAFT_505118 [Massarina eburnea CBS 473.64]|uniref:Chromo domain-containing protein n=1 Tax=Massarina eburnea CBS 473.64 TaxID=1395130 RepID=A0A6A6S994_9PLEO|nr:hypothetical protein P280DRAFT_505118 [Massarina eburnea CBS 473.64]